MKYIQQQRLELEKWQLLPAHRGTKGFAQLLDNEFVAASARKKNLDKRLSMLVKYCADRVPHYQAEIRNREIDILAFAGVKQLCQFPIIDRTTLMDNCDQLQSVQLPADQAVYGFTSTSGSTGEPVKVLHTIESTALFGILKHREYRAWSFDPSHQISVIRPAEDIRTPNQEMVIPKSTVALKGWLYMKDYFHTGEMRILPDTSDADFMAQWVADQNSKYLMAMAAVLEQIALVNAGTQQRPHLDAVLSISQQLTDGMAQLIRENVAPRLHQNYGLNEFGLVAMQCPESDQFHVHNENCLIEIVDRYGERCEPGTPGKLLLTSLCNLAMPLIRYDTDDLAEYPLEACPCGRTMQSFVNLKGRYRRTAHLPIGTWEYWEAILTVFREAPSTEMKPIKQYQLHQITKNQFHLKIKVNKPLCEKIKSRIQNEWNRAMPEPSARLDIFEVGSIEKYGRKFQSFISDITPEEH